MSTPNPCGRGCPSMIDRRAALQQVEVLGSEKAAWFKDTEGNVLCIHQTI